MRLASRPGSTISSEQLSNCRVAAHAVAALTRGPTRPLLAALGVASIGIWLPAAAADAPPLRELREIVVTADRQADSAMTAKVTTALRQDPYIFSDHVTVRTENGIVRLEGRVNDLVDLFQMLKLARRIAGKGRVVNAIDYVPTDDDSD